MIPKIPNRFLLAVVVIFSLFFGKDYALATETIMIEHDPGVSGVGIPGYFSGIWYGKFIQKYEMDRNAYIKKIHVNINYNPARGEFNWNWGILDETYTNLYSSGTIYSTSLPTDSSEGIDLVLNTSLFQESDDYFYLYIEKEGNSDCSGYICINSLESTDENNGNGIMRCKSDLSSCYDLPTYMNPIGSSVYVSDLPQPPSAPTLFSPPSLPYTSSSTPIGFTTLSADGGSTICINLENDWRQVGAFGGTNSYTSFWVDVEEGVNSIKCHVEKGGQISTYLDFDLTLDTGSGGILTPIFNETQPNYNYSYNPIRISVTGRQDGNIWCKKGSGSFVNYGGYGGEEEETVLFFLDFTDLGELEDGLEYTVSCYLEATEGNSEKVSQIYKYNGSSFCIGDFGSSTGDSGIVYNIFSYIYSGLSKTPIIGDLMVVDCIIYDDFYLNLETLAVEDLSYTINLFGQEHNTLIPLVLAKNTMQNWVDSSTGYSSIKDEITTVVWCIILFTIFFKFVYPQILQSDKDEDQEFKKASEAEYHDETTKILDL